jgi:hypothetical protein
VTDASLARAGAAKGYRVFVRSLGVEARIITDLSLEYLSDARIIVKGDTVGLSEDRALTAPAGERTSGCG